MAGCRGGDDRFSNEEFADFRWESIREFHVFGGEERDSDGVGGVDKSLE